MNKPYGQKALNEAVARQNAEKQAREKAEVEKREQAAKQKEQAYRSRSEFREWAALAVAILGLILSAFSIYWQAPLH